MSTETRYDGRPVETARRPRLYHLDHLRASLTMLVVVHHLACTYAIPGAWYYSEITPGAVATTVLAVLALLDQAFFMGLFFLIAGYFTPGALDRKGGKAFTLERIVRLAVPLVIFVLVIGPLSSLIASAAPHSTASWQQAYLAGLGAGPMWFVETLLVFGLLYVLARRVLDRRPGGHAMGVVAPASARRVTYPLLALAALVLAALSFLIRIVLPMNVPLLDLPTPDYLPQYVGMFVVGVLAYRNGWLDRLPAKAGRVGFLTAGVATLILFPAAILASPGSEFTGQGHWQSAVFALWDSIFSVSLSIGLISAYRRYAGRPSRIGTWLSGGAYTTYIIHAPILVTVSVALYLTHLPTLAKFGIAVVIAIPACFVLASLVRRIPGTRRVL